MSFVRKCWHVANAVVRRGYWFNHRFLPETQKFERYRTFDTEVVNLGTTSSLHAFNYEGLGIKAANWAMSMNPLQGDLGILKNYSSYLKDGGATVIMSLCPFSSLAGSYDYLDDRYYRILYPTTIPHYSYTHWLRVNERWQSPIWHYPFYAIFMDIYRIFVKKDANRSMTEEQMEADAQMRIRGWFSEFSLKDFETPLSLRNKDAIMDAACKLDQMIDFCEEHGYKPVMIVPPMYHTLADKFTSKARTMLIDNMIDEMKHKDVRFFNYMNDDAFTHSRELFADSFDLNPNGAKVFTKRVLSDIGVLK